MRVFNSSSTYLRAAKDGAGYEQAPEAAHAQLLDDKVGADTA